MEMAERGTKYFNRNLNAGEPRPPRLPRRHGPGDARPRRGAPQEAEPARRHHLLVSARFASYLLFLSVVLRARLGVFTERPRTELMVALSTIYCRELIHSFVHSIAESPWEATTATGPTGPTGRTGRTGPTGLLTATAPTSTTRGSTAEVTATATEAGATGDTDTAGGARSNRQSK